MKKIVMLISSFILLFSIILIVNLDGDDEGKNLVAYDDNNIIINIKERVSSTSTITFSYITTTKTRIETTNSSIPSYIVAENGVSSTLINNVYKHFLNIPSNVQDSFIADGWKIVIVKGNLNKRFGYDKSILGITIYKDKTIYIDNRYVAASSLEHEMGHYVNYKNNWIDSSKEFQNIFESERASFIKFTGSISDNTSTTIEYYAEAFQEYVWHPDKLLKYCPRTYEFIKRNSKRL